MFHRHLPLIALEAALARGRYDHRKRGLEVDLVTAGHPLGTK